MLMEAPQKLMNRSCSGSRGRLIDDGKIDVEKVRSGYVKDSD